MFNVCCNLRCQKFQIPLVSCLFPLSSLGFLKNSSLSGVCTLQLFECNPLLLYWSLLMWWQDVRELNNHKIKILVF